MILVVSDVDVMVPHIVLELVDKEVFQLVTAEALPSSQGAGG